MKRKLFIISFLISSWILNSGFLFKPNIKVLTCGDNDYLSNISPKMRRKFLTIILGYLIPSQGNYTLLIRIKIP